jgi:large subunit ribosomal protein L22
MTAYKYAFKTDKENVVKTVGRDVSLSPKAAFEICRFVKGKSVAQIKGMLELVKEKKLAVPYTKATNGVGHKPGPLGAGKYPLKGSIEFLKLIKQLEGNAQNKGLGSNLTIIHACAQRAAEPARQGRKRRVQVKRCHIELAAQEAESKKAAKKAPKKEAHKDASENNA